MDGSVLEEKSSFKMLGLTLSFRLGWGSYIISTAKTASKKIGALTRSMKFLSPEIVLYLYKSTIQPCMKYCCHDWTGAPSCYLNCWISYKNRNVGLLVLHLLPLFKACVRYFLSNFYFTPNDSPSKTMKNVFYFI